MGAKREQYDPLRYADRGAHRLRPREVDALRLAAERAGAPLPPAGVAFLASDQEAVGMGDDGLLWVREATTFAKFPVERLRPSPAVSLGDELFVRAGPVYAPAATCSRVSVAAVAPRLQIAEVPPSTASSTPFT